MKRYQLMLRVIGIAMTFFLPFAHAQVADEPLPDFFEDTFLIIPEDIDVAKDEGKRLLLYFGQPGCPYCRETIVTNFTQKPIVEMMKNNFLSIGFSIYGSREVEWVDGKSYTEKSLAKLLRVQFTPTILLLDEKGAVLVRVNGYYPPQRFLMALRYVSEKQEGKISFAEWMKGAPEESANPKLNSHPALLKAPYDLAELSKKSKKHTAVIFSTKYCGPCDEFFNDALTDPRIQATLKDINVLQLNLASNQKLTTPKGEKTKAHDWGKALKISYAPSIVFFDPSGEEVFRIEAYFKPPHFASSFEYVSKGAYVKAPEFQRWLQGR